MCSFQGAHDVSISALTKLTLRFSEEMVAHYQAVLKAPHDHRPPLWFFEMWFTVLPRSGYFFESQARAISRSFPRRRSISRKETRRRRLSSQSASFAH